MYTSPHGQGLVNQPPTPRPTSAWSLLLEAQHFIPYPRTLVYTSGSQKRGLGMKPLQDTLSTRSHYLPNPGELSASLSLIFLPVYREVFKRLQVTIDQKQM